MDTLTRSRDHYAQAAHRHEMADLKEALDEVGSSHPLLVYAYEEDAGPEGDSPLDGAILEGLVHP